MREKSENLAHSVYRATNGKMETVFYKFSLFPFLARTLNLYKIMCRTMILDCSKCAVVHNRKK